MKKALRAGLITLAFGLIAISFAVGGGLISADVASDSSRELLRILLYIGGGLLALGIILITSATITLRR